MYLEFKILDSFGRLHWVDRVYTFDAVDIVNKVDTFRNICP